MTATVSLASESFEIAKLSRIAKRDQLAKSDRLAVYKLAASCGGAINSIHGDVYDWWAEFDREIFQSLLSPCLIVIGITEHSGSLGQCHAVEGQSRITLHQATCFPAETEHDITLMKRDEEPTRWGYPKSFMGRQFMKDVLIHEMCHQAQADLGLRKPFEDAHNSKSWSDLCNHAAKYLGISDQAWFPEYRRRKTKTEDGKRRNSWVAINLADAPEGVYVASQKETASFPHMTFDRIGLSDARYGS